MGGGPARLRAAPGLAPQARAPRASRSGGPVSVPTSVYTSVYHPRRHAAAHTDEYLFAQIIPYLGNKRKLLPLIAEAVVLTGLTSGTFADLFAGSGVVSRWAKARGFRVVCNDWEPYARALNGCFVGLNAAPMAATVFDALNALAPREDGHLARHYCPRDDRQPDPMRERCFWTRANGRKLDTLRQQIADWEHLTAGQRDYLLGPLLYAASHVSNTSGLFKAYHHGWGGRTGTALYRILSDVRLAPPILMDNGLDNRVTQMDAQALAEGWGAIVGPPPDIAYLDPPYNQHPYGSNYHLLNTLALWDKPAVPPFGPGSKSAIRTDWRLERCSAFNHAGEALAALCRLVDALPARWVLLSYSTDGSIPIAALLDALTRRGATWVLPCRYKRYRVSAPRMSARSHTVEFVLALDKSQAPQPGRIDAHRACLAEAQA